MNDKLIGKAQALKELLESGNLRDDCVVYLPEWPVIDMTDLAIPEQTEDKP